MLSYRVQQLEADLQDMVAQLEAYERGQYRIVRTRPEPDAPPDVTQATIDRERRVVEAFNDLLAQFKSKPLGENRTDEAASEEPDAPEQAAQPFPPERPATPPSNENLRMTDLLRSELGLPAMQDRGSAIFGKRRSS